MTDRLKVRNVVSVPQEAAGAQLPALTDTQAKRLAAHVAGESMSAIARSEGVSRQAVAKTLTGETVRGFLASYADRQITTIKTNVATGERQETTSTLVEKLVKQIVDIAMGAEKPIVLSCSDSVSSSQKIQYVPDHRTQLDAATRLLTIFADAQRPATAAAPDVVDEIQEVETTHTRERRVRRSTTSPQAPG